MAVGGSNAIFRYKTVKGPLHRLPAMLKLFLLLPLSIFFMSLPSLYLAAGIGVALAAAFFFGFTLREQLTDLKPAILYAVLMYALYAFSAMFENWSQLSSGEVAAAVLMPKPDFSRVVLRLVLIIQLSALLFRTTSAVEIRESLGALEKRILFFRKNRSQSRFSENISLFLSFIPEIFANWTAINLAWEARGGKRGIKKILTTIFVLISLSMEKAALKAKALEARTYRIGGE